MRESTLEKRLVDAVKKSGGVAYKFASPGRRGVPDRLVLYPIPPEHRAIVEQYVRFVEVKAPGGKLSELQKYELGRLRAFGFCAGVIWSVDDVEVVGSC